MTEQQSAGPAPPEKELAGTREQLAAMQEILQVITKSRSDETPIFDAILSNAARLCQAPVAWLLLVNDSRTELSLAAYHGLTRRALVIGQSWPLTLVDDLSGLGLAIVHAKTCQDEDLSLSPAYLAGDAGMVQLVEEESMRTRVSVPLVLNDTCIGAIVLSRREVHPFSDDEIRLVDTFADQAVIAIENVRQFHEVQTRLERERATGEVLQVISQSRDDEQPVFDKILQKACDLCDVPDAALMLLNPAGTHFRIRAHRGTERVDIAKAREWAVDDPLPISQSFREATTVHIADMQQSAPYLAGDPTYLRMVDDEGLRARLCVPLIVLGKAFGVIALSRYEQRPFSQDEIDLIETFAAQAVIAIENVRQFREVQERLKREAATSDVLSAISQSRADAGPVFRIILDNAARLCGAPHALLLLRDAADEYLSLAASNAAKSAFIDRIRDRLHRLDNTDSYAVRAVRERRVIHLQDLSDAAELADKVPQIKDALDLEGMHTVLQVPLLQGDRAIGVIALYKLHVAPFTQDQIDLVRTFAAQAVIAIENAKQLQTLETLNAELGARVEKQVGEIERMGKLKRFLPAAVADTVISSGSEQMLKSHRALLGVLFCDIRGFTAFCETAEPEETIEVLQTYHEEMGKLINAHGAGVDHRMGDGIMVLFNDPLPCEDPARDAVRLAVAMRAKMVELSRQWKRLGHRLGFGVGVSLGYATVGMVGYEDRSDYTASGTAINVGSRLCEMAEDGEILLSTRAAIAVEDEFPSVSAGEVTLKGIREPVEVFRMTDSTAG